MLFVALDTNLWFLSPIACSAISFIQKYFILAFLISTIDLKFIIIFLAQVYHFYVAPHFYSLFYLHVYVDKKKLISKKKGYISITKNFINISYHLYAGEKR